MVETKQNNGMMFTTYQLAQDFATIHRMFRKYAISAVTVVFLIVLGQVCVIHLARGVVSTCCLSCVNVSLARVGSFMESFLLCHPLVICNIAIENGTFIVDLPIKSGDFP